MAYSKAALVGLDGSGKSAKIRLMKTDTDFSDYRFVWVRWKPILLWPAYRLMNGRVKKQSASEEHQPQEQRQAGADYQAKSGMKKRIFRYPFIRGIWMALALTDYFFQFYWKTGKLLLSGKKIVFDRFYLDLFVDQGINFGYSPEKIGRCIRRWQWLFPTMDATIYLRVAPEICFQRKDDIPSMDYLLKRYDIYEYLSRESGWLCVDGEGPLNEVYADIKRHLTAGGEARIVETK